MIAPGLVLHSRTPNDHRPWRHPGDVAHTATRSFLHKAEHVAEPSLCAIPGRELRCARIQGSQSRFQTPGVLPRTSPAGAPFPQVPAAPRRSCWQYRTSPRCRDCLEKTVLPHRVFGDADRSLPARTALPPRNACVQGLELGEELHSGAEAPRKGGPSADRRGPDSRASFQRTTDCYSAGYGRLPEPLALPAVVPSAGTYLLGCKDFSIDRKSTRLNSSH